MRDCVRQKTESADCVVCTKRRQSALCERLKVRHVPRHVPWHQSLGEKRCGSECASRESVEGVVCMRIHRALWRETEVE